jgi:hypothetical protein
MKDIVTFENVLLEELLNETSQNVIDDTTEIDVKLLSKLMQRRLMVTIDTTKLIDESVAEFKKNLYQLFNVFSSKVSDEHVNYVTQYVVSKYPLLVSLSTVDVFIFKTIFDVSPINGEIQKVSLVVIDEELFNKSIEFVKNYSEKSEQEKQEFFNEVYEKIELNVADYYYGVFLKSIVLALSLLNKSKVKFDYELHLLVTNILTDMILRGFGKKYTSGLDDTKINLTRTVVLYLLLVHYFDYKPDIALETSVKLVTEQYAKFNNITDKNRIEELRKYLLDTIKQNIPKYNLVTDIKYLGLYLEKLGIVFVNTTQFLIEFARKFKKYYSYIIVAYPYLVSTLIASLYPITESPDVGSTELVKQLKKHVFENYLTQILK